MSTDQISRLLEDRVALLGSWLESESPYVQFDQGHLDGGTPAQAYWHLGYRAALCDLLELVRQTDRVSGDASVSPALDGTGAP